MNDEFSISKTVVVGSSGSSTEIYHLDVEGCAYDIDNLNLDKIDRLQIFLAEYVKKERSVK